MELVFIEKITPGMTVAQDIQDPEAKDVVLVTRGTRLTALMIDSMQKRGIRFAYIQRKPFAARSFTPVEQEPAKKRPLYVPQPKHVITSSLRTQAIDSLQDTFWTISSFADDIHASSSQVIRQLDTVVGQLVDSLSGDERAMVNISDLKSYDEYTFHHSLSVAVLSIAIGQHIGFDRNELRRLGLCAIMHDIGKTAIPLEIINKPTRLTDEEFERIQAHSIEGYSYVFRNQIGDDQLWRGVMHHHEKTDGTGYPFGLSGNDIPLWSRIISVADVYDALTSNRPYRQPMQPADALEYIMGGIGTAFDYDIVSSFLQKVELYPPGSTVELSNGQLAYVISTAQPMRPVIRLAETGDIVDLYNERSWLSTVIVRLVQRAETEDEKS